MTASSTAFMPETAAAVDAALDQTAVERFRARLDGPLAVVASGGSFTAAALWAHLHESAGQPAWAMTPYAFAQRSLPRGTGVLLLSAGGHHHDIVQSASLAIGRGHVTRAAIGSARSPLAERVVRAGSSEDVLVLPEPRHADGLIVVHGLVALAVLAARLYAGPGPWAPMFEAEGLPMPPPVPRFVVAFGAGAAEPAAVDFANRCQESGLAPAWQTDVRHFAHGQFMLLQDDRAGMVIAAFATRSQRAYLERFCALLPASTRVCRIEVETEGAPAALALLGRGMRTFEQLAAHGSGLPTAETIPAWSRALYELTLDELTN